MCFYSTIRLLSWAHQSRRFLPRSGQDTLYENSDGKFITIGSEVASQAMWSQLVAESAWLFLTDLKDCLTQRIYKNLVVCHALLSACIHKISGSERLKHSFTSFRCPGSSAQPPRSFAMATGTYQELSVDFCIFAFTVFCCST